MQATQLDLTADTIDVRDIIARVEELNPEYSDIKLTDDEAEELAGLQAILDELKGNGGDEQWRGDWYPITLIDATYFTLYVRELVFDCGDLPKDLPHWVEIDWDATARNVRTDYAQVEISGRTYWYR